MLKRKLAALLAALMLLTLTACGGSAPAASTPDNTQTQQDAAEQAAKEEAERLAREEAERKAKEEAERLAREEAERKAKELADKVNTIRENLLTEDPSSCRYEMNGETFRGNAAQVLWYRDLLELGDIPETADLRAQFVLLENVHLYTDEVYTDRMGNTRNFTCNRMQYDAAGRVIAAEYISDKIDPLFHIFYPWPMEDSMYITYDENGNATEMRNISHFDKLNAIVTYSYENGALTKGAFSGISGDAEITYQCDDQGRLVKRSWHNGATPNYAYDCTFTYDDAGRITNIHMERTRLNLPKWAKNTWDWTFTYADGKPVSMAYEHKNYNGNNLTYHQVDETVYTCDEAGRVLSSVTTSKELVKTTEEPVLESTHHYGDWLTRVN